MKKKWLFYIGFFILLVIGFYVTLTQIIPGYGKVKLPVLSNVQPFHFTNQEGRPVSEQDVQGKVFVAGYFFTTCQSICPIMNTNIRDVYEAYKEQPDFLILSHTVDPLNDTVGRLKWYADSMKVDARRWWFLTGKKDSLYQAARTSYLLDDPKNNLTNIDEQFLHTQFVALVDRSGRVRKIYDGLKKDEVHQLINDIAVLLKEPASTSRFSNNLFSN